MKRFFIFLVLGAISGTTQNKFNFGDLNHNFCLVSFFHDKGALTITDARTNDFLGKIIKKLKEKDLFYDGDILYFRGEECDNKQKLENLGQGPFLFTSKKDILPISVQFNNGGFVNKKFYQVRLNSKFNDFKVLHKYFENGKYLSLGDKKIYKEEQETIFSIVKKYNSDWFIEEIPKKIKDKITFSFHTGDVSSDNILGSLNSENKNVINSSDKEYSKNTESEANDDDEPLLTSKNEDNLLSSKSSGGDKDKKKNPVGKNSNTGQKVAFIGVGFSLLISIVGVGLYFSKKHEKTPQKNKKVNKKRAASPKRK